MLLEGLLAGVLVEHQLDIGRMIHPLKRQRIQALSQTPQQPAKAEVPEPRVIDAAVFDVA